MWGVERGKTVKVFARSKELSPLGGAESGKSTDRALTRQRRCTESTGPDRVRDPSQVRSVSSVKTPSGCFYWTQQCRTCQVAASSQSLTVSRRIFRLQDALQTGLA